MKRTQRMLIAAALSATLAAPLAAFATALPSPKTQGDITYISGGVGHDEAEAMEQAAKEWPLALEFAIKAKPHDEYASNVKVSIRDMHGKTVFDSTANGPFLLLKLTPGKYVVTAERDHHKLERHVTLAANQHKREVFVWAS